MAELPPLDPIAEETIEVIRATDLTPIEHRILSDFVKNAEDPKSAAEEIRARISGRSASETPETVLQQVKQELFDLVKTIEDQTRPRPAVERLLHERDESQCCLSPKDQPPLEDVKPVATYILPPSLLDLVNRSNSHMRLLRAFLSDDFVSVLSDTSERGTLANSWLLAPDLPKLFRMGIANLTPRGTYSWKLFDEATMITDSCFELKLFISRAAYDYNIAFADGSKIDFQNGTIHFFELKTKDPQRLPIVSPWMLKGYSGLAFFVDSFIDERRIAQGWGPPESPRFWSRTTQLWLRALWYLVPRAVRSFIWCRVFNWAKDKSSYDVPISMSTRKLPCGLYVKMSQTGNEPAALRLLEAKAPRVPAPLYIDSFSADGSEWFVMTKMPGVRVEVNIWRMSYQERKDLAKDLRSVLDDMRRIPNPNPYMFCNVSGGRIHDDRVSTGGCGPFNTEADLNAQLCRGVERRLKELHPDAFSKQHKSVFTHGDLYFSNVLIDGGKLSAIIDWEFSGFMPEYWDFTKPLVSSRTHQDTTAVYRDIWGHEYDQELKAESWLGGVAFHYGGPPEPGSELEQYFTTTPIRVVKAAD